MSEHTDDFRAATIRTIRDVIALRGARSGTGFIRSNFILSGRRQAAADALEPAVPEGARMDDVASIVPRVAARIAADPGLAARIRAAMVSPPTLGQTDAR